MQIWLWFGICDLVWQLITCFKLWKMTVLIFRKFPTILDSFLNRCWLYQESSNMGGWWGLEVGKMLTFKNETGKCMDGLGQVIGHSGLKSGWNWRKFIACGVYWILQGCKVTHSHLQTGQDNISICTDRHCVLEKQSGKADHWMVACSVYEV